jgi:addiction module RelE/StbE family toxin
MKVIVPKVIRKRLSKANPVIMKRMDSVLKKFSESQTGDIGGYLQDHQLQGKLRKFRELHLDGDCLLVYKVENGAIILRNIYSHKELDSLEGSLVLFSSLNITEASNETQD